MDVGIGTNTRFELLAVWGLLLFACTRNILQLQVMGDSMVIVDWALGIHNIHSVDLAHWLSRVKGIFRCFNSVSFQHIYREHNSLAAELSKKAIGLGGGLIFWEDFAKGFSIDSSIVNLFWHVFFYVSIVAETNYTRMYVFLLYATACGYWFFFKTVYLLSTFETYCFHEHRRLEFLMMEDVYYYDIKKTMSLYLLYSVVSKTRFYLLI